MALKHLDGNRTGRPPGSKNRPPWVRAALWAFKHLDDEDAVPPSPLARRLLELGREHPDKLLAVLLKIDGARSSPKADSAPRVSKKTEAPSRRLRKVSLSGSRLFETLGLELSRVPRLPPYVEIVGIAVSTRGAPTTLTLRSPMFEEVPEDQPIPEVSW